TLAPREAGYYERLVGKSEAQSLDTFLLDSTRSDVSWAADTPLERAQWLLLRASQPGIVTAADFAALSKEDWRTLGSWAVQSGDLLAKLCFGEHALPLAHTDPELERVLIEIGRQMGELDPADKSAPLHLLSSLIVFVDGELSLHGVLSHWPPFRRRQAAIAQ